jgi:hypothetical protein
VVQEDPAAVAARKEARKKTERVLLIAVGVGVGVFALIAGVNFLRDTREAMAAANRPKQPWEL